LKEELAANSILTQNLKADLQKKEEDCAELKEKFIDAKKQIEQVQREVSYMKSCVGCWAYYRYSLGSKIRDRF
jgi:kinesin family protein 20